MDDFFGRRSDLAAAGGELGVDEGGDVAGAELVQFQISEGRVEVVGGVVAVAGA
ncbi:hypothetical protein ACFQ7F_00790 [Streptomyces sp. NPDC056486]|uniref:hypothetical protein n=1 Tax=Streptomyces sp. NPDC056486 TaxID=3345835 RepID=UPI0036946402